MLQRMGVFVKIGNRMNRIIIDYLKLNQEILDLLIEKFPEGYGYRDILIIEKPNGDTIKAVEVRTEDTIYLVKISSQLEQSMVEHAEEDDVDEIVNEIDEEIGDDILNSGLDFL
jgi:hypothetical protein